MQKVWLGMGATWYEAVPSLPSLLDTILENRQEKEMIYLNQHLTAAYRFFIDRLAHPLFVVISVIAFCLIFGVNLK